MRFHEALAEISNLKSDMSNTGCETSAGGALPPVADLLSTLRLFADRLTEREVV